MQDINTNILWNTVKDGLIAAESSGGDVTFEHSSIMENTAQTLIFMITGGTITFKSCSIDPDSLNKIDADTIVKDEIGEESFTNSIEYWKTDNCVLSAARTPDQTPDQTPDKTPDRTPDQTPDKTPDRTPEMTPKKTVVFTPHHQIKLDRSIDSRFFFNR